jgi:hypothetical protein
VHTLITRPPEIDVELAQLEAHVTDSWPDLPRPFVVPWTEVTVLTLDRDTPWVYGPAEKVPIRGHRGHTVIPRRQRAQLQAIATRGAPFQRVAIADELDPQGPVRELLPALRHGPLPCHDDLARQLIRPVPAHPAVSRAARALDALVGGTSRATGRALDALLDPIVFGVIAPTTPQHGDLSLWFPLVGWKW